MKTVLSILIVLWSGSFANAQKLNESQVPASVISAFHKMYPAEKDNGWEMEDGNYEAEMNNSAGESSVIFTATGALIQTEKEISVKELPAAIANYVSKNYAGAEIKEAAQITDVKGVKTFEAEVKDYDLIFDAKGNFVREERDSNEVKDSEDKD